MGDAGDPVQQMIEQWRRERPDLDPASMSVFARLTRCHQAASVTIEATLSPFGVNRGEFDVLASLRRSGRPFALTAGALADAVVLSPSAMTNRLRRLETRQLIRRAPDPDNGRNVIVSLTTQGRRLVDRAVNAHVANLDRQLAALSDAEKRSLAQLLRRLDATTTMT